MENVNTRCQVYTKKRKLIFFQLSKNNNSNKITGEIKFQLFALLFESRARVFIRNLITRSYPEVSEMNVSF